MNKVVPILKDENDEHPVPHAWRKTLSDIVDSIKDNCFELSQRVPGVDSVSAPDASRIAANVSAYGGELVSLPEDAWKSSVCRWTGDHWLVLLDLSTTNESPSDLVLFVDVFEDGPSYRFKVDSVHVP